MRSVYGLSLLIQFGVVPWILAPQRFSRSLQGKQWMVTTKAQ